MSIVERLARLKQPELPASGVRYTRKVTQAWCVFFVVNGAIGLGTALFADLETWTLYNGLIAYLLIGLMAGIEFLIRKRVQSKYGH